MEMGINIVFMSWSPNVRVSFSDRFLSHNFLSISVLVAMYASDSSFRY